MRDMERSDYSIWRVLPLMGYVRHGNVDRNYGDRSRLPSTAVVLARTLCRIAAHAVPLRARFNSWPELLNGLRCYEH
jgi:hypothetical protein